MKLEVGKKYKNRNGNIVIIQFKSTLPCPYPFIGVELLTSTTSTSRAYTESGICLDNCKSYDIVEEIDKDIADNSFKSVQEIYAYLGAGGIVKVKNNAIIYYFENDELTREYTKDGRKETQREKDTHSEMMFVHFDTYRFEKYEKPITKSWDDDIPEQGIICMATYIDDGGKEFDSLAVIISVEGTFYRCDSGFLWGSVRPATLEDITPYLYESK